MRKNLIVLGERWIEGDYNCIMAAGEVQIANSNIKKLHLAGEGNISHSVIHKLRCAGEIEADEINFNDVSITGEVSLHGICKADIFKVTGELSADYLECRILRIGTPKFKPKMKEKTYLNINLNGNGTIKAETFENFYPVLIFSDCEFKNIISSALLIFNGEIVCDNFYSFGGGIQGESINAENITIVSDDQTNIDSVVGSNIRICKTFQKDRLFRSIPKSVCYKKLETNNSISNITNIEGDKINIEYTKADLVSGIDVVVGELCVVDRVEYRNNIHISPKSVVNKVVKL